MILLISPAFYIPHVHSKHEDAGPPNEYNAGSFSEHYFDYHLFSLARF